MQESKYFRKKDGKFQIWKNMPVKMKSPCMVKASYVNKNNNSNLQEGHDFF